MMMNCPLCHSDNHQPFYSEETRFYHRCQQCFLIFVDQTFWLKNQEEKAIYDLHENSSDDQGYRDFLNRLFTPMNELIKSKSKGLDFGSGNGPTLSKMFEEAGHQVELFDKYYADRAQVFEKKYDFILATEVIEHLSKPRFELERLLSVLRPAGYLGIMTKLARDKKAFATWHYKNDPTHICFYSRETFEWIARIYQLGLEFIGNDVIILNALKF